MKRLHKTFQIVQDMLGILVLVFAVIIGGFVIVYPQYVGFKAWCMNQAIEQIFFFEEPTDEELKTMAEMKLCCRLHKYLQNEWPDMKSIPPSYYTKFDIIESFVWGEAHRNVKILYKWHNPVTKKDEINMLNIRLNFHVIGDMIDPYMPTIEILGEK